MACCIACIALVGSAIELSDAQLRLTTAMATRVEADYYLASARAQLLAALGRDWPTHSCGSAGTPEGEQAGAGG